MTFILADAIDFPLVFAYGMAVLIPLMLFQVGVEGWVFRALWHLPFKDAARFAFRANCWSLAAGIPTKILNAFVYGALLPGDIPGFFAQYPFAVALGTLIYFLVTVVVERATAIRWRGPDHQLLPDRRLWLGILSANLATYAVLAPLHYYATLPMSDAREYTRDTKWSSHLDTPVFFVDSDDGHLKLTRLGNQTATTVAPASVKDYLVSTNADVCLFRNTGGDLILYQHSSGWSNLVWQTDERYSMNQVAFSPSGERVAFASGNEDSINVLELGSGKKASAALQSDASDLNVAWSPDETRLYVSTGRNRFAANIAPDFSVRLEPLTGTNEPALLPCYGRVGPGRWSGGGDWGKSYRNDSCNQFRAWAIPGLGSSLRVYRDGSSRGKVFTMAVNPGLLHLSSIYFGDVAFLEGCNECLVDAGGYVYLIDIERRRVGTVGRGNRFVLLTPRYQKHL